MQPYQQRVLVECNELADKTQALYIFLSSKKFNELDTAEQVLLKTQYYAMAIYLQVLEQRIQKFQT